MVREPIYNVARHPLNDRTSTSRCCNCMKQTTTSPGSRILRWIHGIMSWYANSWPGMWDNADGPGSWWEISAGLFDDQNKNSTLCRATINETTPTERKTCQFVSSAYCARTTRFANRHPRKIVGVVISASYVINPA